MDGCGIFHRDEDAYVRTSCGAAAWLSREMVSAENSTTPYRASSYFGSEYGITAPRKGVGRYGKSDYRSELISHTREMIFQFAVEDCAL